jgi:hypothetical protein
MYKFPDNFDKKRIIIVLKENQEKLLEDTRQRFYDEVYEVINKCNDTLKFDIGNILRYDLKLKLVEEILDRFGEIIIINSSDNSCITKSINHISDAIEMNFNNIELIFNICI